MRQAEGYSAWIAMSDIHETESAYDAACKELGAVGHPMILEMFAVDKEDNAV